MKKLIPIVFALALVCLIGNAQADIPVSGATGDYVTGSFDYSLGEVGRFFVNESDWKDNIWFSFRDNKVYYTVKIPTVSVGSYSIPILCHVAFNDTSCGINNSGCYADKIEHVGDFSITVTEAVKEVRDIPLPKSGLLRIDQMLDSEAGFSVSVSEIGADSAIIRTVNCDEESRNVEYDRNATFTCGSCDVVVKPEYRFLDSAGIEHIKLRMFSNCYNYIITLSGEGVDVPSDCEIDIQVIGNAIRGQALTVLTKDNNGNSISANIIMTDSSPYTEDQLFVTSTPWKGIGKASFDEASIAPVTILARNEELNCEGQYIINELSGKLILPNETQEDEDLPKLEIRDLPEEVYEDGCFAGSVYADGSLVTNDDAGGNIVHIRKPESDEYTMKTKLNSSDAFAVCVGSKLSSPDDENPHWTLKASYEGYEDSDEYTVKAMEPRKRARIMVKLANDIYYRTPEELGQVASGTSIMIALAEVEEYVPEPDGSAVSDIIEEDIEIEARFAGKTEKVGLTKGYGMYMPPKDITSGEIVFKIPKNDLFEEWSSGPLMVVEGLGFGWLYEYLLYGVVAFIIIVLFVLILRRRGGSVEEAEPEEYEASPGEVEALE